MTAILASTLMDRRTRNKSVAIIGLLYTGKNQHELKMNLLRYTIHKIDVPKPSAQGGCHCDGVVERLSLVCPSTLYFEGYCTYFVRCSGNSSSGCGAETHTENWQLQYDSPALDYIDLLPTQL